MAVAGELRLSIWPQMAERGFRLAPLAVKIPKEWNSHEVCFDWVVVKLSLVIPCFNEALNLSLLLSRCAEVAAKAPCEILLVDNGSTDDTEKILPNLLRGHRGVRSVRVSENQGYGFGILSGLRAAEGDILAWTHADIQTDPLDVVTGFDIFKSAPRPERLFVKGRRHGRPLMDVVFTAGMSAFETVLLRCPLNDINAQPTLFHRAFFEKWTCPPSDFSLDLYAFFMARRLGLEVKRFPVKFGKRAFGVSHWNVGWRGKQKFITRTIDYSLRLRASLSQSRGI